MSNMKAPHWTFPTNAHGNITAMGTVSPRATLAANLRKQIEHDLGPGSRFSVRAWVLARELGGDNEVRLISRLINGDNAVTLDKLDEVAALCGLKAWQLLLDDFDPASPAEAPISEEDRKLLVRLRRLIADNLPPG